MQNPRRRPRIRIDIHAHLAGTGTGGSGCWISPGFRRRSTFLGLRLLFRITPRAMRESADQDWAAMLARRVRESRLDHAVALGFDGVYDPRTGELDRERSQMVIPPAWVVEACRRHPELIPGPSINPFRRDALERLEEAVAGGAALIKWLPITQAIDPSDPRIREFYEVLAAAGVPLLIHMGGERTFATIAPHLNNVNLLEAPLRAGVPVICAHTATSVLLGGEPDQIPRLRDLLAEYPHLWVDNSGLANPGRFHHVARLAADPLIRERTLYGSDFPVPTNSVYFASRLGLRAVRRLEAIRNPFDRDVLTKLAMGYPPETLYRAARVIPSLARRFGGRTLDRPAPHLARPRLTPEPGSSS